MTDTADRFRSYSPERRTAVVLSGTGAHGAYHAGVLRAFHEAGVKIDILAGHGVGAANAALAAIDGGARLWDEEGVWRSGAIRSLYRWQPRTLGFAATVVAVVVILSGTVAAISAGWLPPPWWIPLIVAVSAAGFGAFAFAGRRRGRPRRRSRGRWWWRLVGSPVDADGARTFFVETAWALIRGAAVDPAASRAASRRYAEVLLENLGQPGFRELVLVASDLDARRDVVAALLREPFRAEFMAPRAGGDRRAELLDLAAAGRDHAMDIVAAGLAPPVICEPALLTFAADNHWRGETHRLCDRPGAVHRLLEEVAAAGATQAIVVTAVAQRAEPHRLQTHGLDPRSRLGEFQMAAESAALRDALEMARLRFDAVFLVCPSHNPVGPFDMKGAYDEASDRRQTLEELMERAYDDAYRQFIEPAVGASGDRMARM